VECHTKDWGFGRKVPPNGAKTCFVFFLGDQYTDGFRPFLTLGGHLSARRQRSTPSNKVSKKQQQLLLLHPFNGLFSRTKWVSRHQKCKTSLDFNEARGDGVLGCSRISWTICKQSAPCSRQITTPTPHHSIFYRLDALPDAEPTMSKH